MAVRSKVLAVIQARMESTRLPGKMLLPILGGKGALEVMLGRVGRARTLDRVVVATTDTRSDDPLADLCERLGFPFFRGSEDDVLDRYYQATRASGPADVVVRLTGDCPLHDPAVIDAVVRRFLKSEVDYACNTSPSTYPDGLDTEAFSFAALEKAWREAKLRSEREHVTPYFRNHPKIFRMCNVAHEQDLSTLRWTLDEPSDLEFVRAVYSYLRGRQFGMYDVLGLLEERPELKKINAGIARNEGLQKSLKEDELLG